MSWLNESELTVEISMPIASEHRQHRQRPRDVSGREYEPRVLRWHSGSNGERTYGGFAFVGKYIRADGSIGVQDCYEPIGDGDRPGESSIPDWAKPATHAITWAVEQLKGELGW
jgi:hypothetical protein